MMKKLLVLMLALVAVAVLCACNNDNAADVTTGEQNATATDPTKTVDVSIPTDSSLADSVFEDVTNPTKAAGDTDKVTENDTVEGATEPAGSSTTEATAPTTAPEDMTYQDFIELTPAEQRLYQESFNDLDAFFAWYNAAKEKYEKENPPTEITGPVVLG